MRYFVMMYVKNIFTLSHKPLEVKSTIDIITTSHGVLGHNTVYGKILVGEKLANLANRELIIFSSPLFTDSIWHMH